MMLIYRWKDRWGSVLDGRNIIALPTFGFNTTKTLSSRYPIIITAIVAESKEAIEPPKSALKPNSDNVLRWPGANEPIPPICIPIEAKLANPHNIYVAIITDLL